MLDGLKAAAMFTVSVSAFHPLQLLQQQWHFSAQYRRASDPTENVWTLLVSDTEPVWNDDSAQSLHS